MTSYLSINDGTIAYDVAGEGPFVVLAHGMGDSRHSYRFLAPALVAAGYRVATVDLRGCGDSSLGWSAYSRTDIAGDLIALIRHLGGPAAIIGQSISGGAATIAAATAPELVTSLVELAPFTRRQSIDIAGLLKVKRHRRGLTCLTGAFLGSTASWQRYLDLAIPAKPADWDAELARITAKLNEPGRMKVLQAMAQSKPTDAGAQLARVRCPVLVIEGSCDPDWADPRAEGERILNDLPKGLGQLAVIDGAGHYLHTEAPDQVLALALPFLIKTARA